MNIVLYHDNCLDGFAAAWVAKKYFEQHYKPKEYIIQPVQYGKPIPEEIMPYLVEGTIVYLLDFSYVGKEIYKLKTLLETCSCVVVLDHHEGALKDLQTLSKEYSNLIYEYSENKSGCIITHKYFFNTRLVYIPQLFYHIQDRDLWKFENSRTKAVTTALFHEERTFDRWSRLMELGEEGLEYLENRGKLLLEVFDKECKDLADKAYPISLVIDGELIKGYILNATPKYASDVGHMLSNLSDSKFGIIWYYDGIENKYQYSVRSTDGKTALAIAKRYGGGGHTNAAGFRLDYLLH